MQVPQTSHKKQPLLHYLAFVLEDFYGKAFFADYWSSIFAGCISFVITEQQYQSSKGETDSDTNDAILCCRKYFDISASVFD